MSRRRGAVVWVLTLLGGAGAVVIGAGSARAGAAPPAAGFCLPGTCPTNPPPTTTTTTTAPTTTSSTSTTSTTSTTVAPTTVPGSPYSVGFVPCGSSNDGPCTAEPTQVEVRYAAMPAKATVQLAWKAAGRAANAPAPDGTSSTMQWSDGTACGSGLQCFKWPAQLTDAGSVLNGTYQLTVCDDTGCKPPVSIGLAAPAGPPTQVQAHSSGRDVVVSWQPPAGAPPDLTGYTVLRGGQAVHSCSVDGLGPAASVRCPSPLQATDQPGNGSFTYSVAALRLGVDSDAAHVVSSKPAGAGGPVAVPGQITAPGSGGTGGHTGASFTPSPVIGGASAVVDPGSTAPTAGGDDGALAGASPEPGAPGTPQNLRYPSAEPVAGGSALALKVHGPGGKPDVVPIGVLALGVLILAVAAHFLYLRARLSDIVRRPPATPDSHA